jgi:hypothetical protein
VSRGLARPERGKGEKWKDLRKARKVIRSSSFGRIVPASGLAALAAFMMPCDGIAAASSLGVLS